MPFICLYCFETKPDSESSEEHILPRALAGRVLPSLFISRRICRLCNSNLGLFADGEFIKNWFTSNYKSDAARRYIDIENGSVLPLIYGGAMKSSPIAEHDSVEFWLGPSGDQIFHVHDSIDERFATYAGGNPIDRKGNPGTAILLSSTTNQKWLKVSLLSFAAHFSRSRRVLGNVGLRSEADERAIGVQPDAIESDWIRILRNIGEGEIPLRVSVRRRFEQRFLAKLALGLGFNLFGESFLDSAYSRKLRRALWEQDPSRRDRVGVLWTGLFQNEQLRFQELLAWPGGLTVLLQPVSPLFVLSLSVWGRGFLHIALSDEPAVWERADDRFGHAYVLIPQRGLCAGPIDLPAYIQQRLSGNFVPEFERVKGWEVAEESLPSYQEE